VTPDRHRHKIRLLPDNLPDLCTPSSVLLLVMLGIAVALIHSLAATPTPKSFWLNFGLAVLFVQWVVMVSAALICGFKRLLAKRGSGGMGWIVFVVIPLVCVCASGIVVLFLPAAEAGDSQWFVLRNTLMSLLASLALVRYLLLQQRWKRQVAAEARARFDALQASIRPHFLFNALNTIASLAHDQPDKAEQATLDLSDLLRIGLRSGATQSLYEELDMVRGYLRLEALRLGDRLKVDWDLADDLPLELELPALLIQPLVENAVVHGIARLPEGGRLSIRAERISRNRLRFEIVNPVAEASARPAESNRMALENIRQRLALAWEEGAYLKTHREEKRFRVELVIPL